MKKTSILLILSLTMCFSACSILPNSVNIDSPPTTMLITPTQNPTASNTNTSLKPEAFSFQIFETGVFDYYSEANHKIEIELETTEKIDTNAEQQVFFSFSGTDYVLPYEKTEEGYLSNSNYDIYKKIEKNKQYVELFLNRNTKRIDMLSCSDFLYLQHLDESAKELDREECLMIVQNFLYQYISDFDMYHFSEDLFYAPEFGIIYQFYFSRFVGGIETSDQATIWITAYGDIILYDIRGLGDMQGAELPTDEEMSQVQTGLDAKILEIYQRLEERYTIEHTIDDVLFIRLADGRYAFKYRIGAELTPKGDGVSHAEVFELLVIIGA